MKILITGGCGFLGTNLAERILAENKSELFIVDNLVRFGSKINLEWLKTKGKFTFIEQDVRYTELIENTIKDIKPDVIFHLAGQVAMTTSISNTRNDFEINVLGSFNILEAVRKHCPLCTIVYSSTNKVYGDLEWTPYEETDKRYIATEFKNGFPENIQLSFHSPYGCSKGAADQYMLDYHRIFDLKTVVFRHSSMYGGRQFSTYDQGWLGWFCQKALETKTNTLKEPYTISGSGKQVRDLLHSEDMINLYFAAAENIDKIKGQAFNIGGGMSNSLSLLELFDVLESELDVKLEYQKLPWRQSDQKVFVADISKYSNATGWIPKVDKLTGIRKMISWVNENGK
ncbi:MAG: NAD-dependent epimerase/dehydratase family protein [Bacteroidota bacterium]